MNPIIQPGQPVQTKKVRKGLKALRLFSTKPSVELSEKTREELELLQSIQLAKKEWLDATACFEYVSDEGLVDYNTYKMKACECRYAYFIKKAKEMGLKMVLPEGQESQDAVIR